MEYKNFAQIKAVEHQNKKRFLAVNDKLTDESGIYFLTRIDENGFKYAYIGQAKHVLTRLAQHMTGYQHIDLSLKKHGLHNMTNPCGWRVGMITCPEAKLDEMEQFYIKEYADHGYQLRNKTSGSQGVGKAQIDDYKPAKGYRDGIAQGRKNVLKDIADLFSKYLNVTTKNDPPNRYQIKAKEKFESMLKEVKDNEQN